MVRIPEDVKEHEDLADKNRYNDPFAGFFDYEPDRYEPLRPRTRTQSRAARIRRRRAKKRRFLTFLLLTVVAAVATAVGVFILGPTFGFGSAPDYPGPGEGVVKIEVKEGVSKMDVATALHREDVVKSPKAFLNVLKERGEKLRQEVVIKPGFYEFRKQMSAADAVDIFIERSNEKVIYIPIEPGQRLSEILVVLSETTQLDINILQDLVNNPRDFGVTAQRAYNLEGYISPGDYRFPVGTAVKDIVQQMVDNTLERLVDSGVQDPEEQYRVLTVASIVQAEGMPQDYAKIAGAIENRLKPDNTETHGFLQIDSTVHYGLNLRDTVQLTKEQKEDKNNLYNTYANPGLPVGPISSPGFKAIQAAVHPELSAYYYWVTVNLDTGETKFARTYAEHEDNVREFNEWCEEHENKCK